MSHQDFDTKALAAYLHLTPEQVTKLAEREKLPGRKVAGDWRFSRAEIHTWMEDRLGLLDEQELTQVEGVLQRAADAAGDAPVSLAERLLPTAIAKPLMARTRRSVIDSMVDLAAATGQLWDPAKLAEAVTAREDMQPTALDNGVALLHPRRPMPNILGEPIVALGITSQGIPFGGARGALTDIFFLLCSVDDRTHLSVLARISRMISDDSYLADLRDAASAGEVYDLTLQAEQEAIDAVEPS